MKIKFTVGSDPEVFIKSEQNGRLIPAYLLTKGTKKKPTKISGGAVLADNVALEFNPDPRASAGAMIERTRHMIQQFMIDRKFPTRGYYFDASPTTKISKKLAEDARALVSGCDPDFDAYKGAGAQRPRIELQGDTRYLAGHLHFGMNPLPPIPAYIMAQFADWSIGLQLVRNGEAQGARRSLYGCAGIYRPKPYGFEYRTPSALWVTNDTMADGIIRGTEWFFRALTLPLGKLQTLYSVIDWARVQSTINNESPEDAAALMQAMGPSLDLVGRAA